MSNLIRLPPLPQHSKEDWWTDASDPPCKFLANRLYTDRELRARDLEIARVVLEAAARECESRSRYHPADTPIERAMLAESKYCAYDIRALEFHHE